MKKLVEGKDFNYSKNGDKVFTKAYLLRRGYCCKSGCTNCPYKSGQELDPSVPSELNDPWKPQESETPEIYNEDIPEDEEL